MIPPNRSFNPKRRIAYSPDPEELQALAEEVEYGGNPEHKRNPGDFGLSPPAAPRADKSKCDRVEIFQRQEALRLLRKGVKRGMIDERTKRGDPLHIWAVTDEGEPLEAILEIPGQATYHGYPMTKADPFAEEVLDQWNGS